MASSTYGSGISGGFGEPVDATEGRIAVVDGGEVIVKPPVCATLGMSTSRYWPGKCLSRCY